MKRQRSGGGGGVYTIYRNDKISSNERKPLRKVKFVNDIDYVMNTSYLNLACLGKRLSKVSENWLRELFLVEHSMKHSEQHTM